MSAEGRNVYVASDSSDAVVVFDRDTVTGGLTQMTDGLLLVRYAFGFRAATLIAGAVELGGCTRCTAELIESFIQGLLD